MGGSGSGRRKTLITKRRCQVCKQVLPIKQFGKAPSKPGGHTYLCLSCEMDRQIWKNTRRRYARMSRWEIQEDIEKAQYRYMVRLKVAGEIAKE